MYGKSEIVSFTLSCLYAHWFQDTLAAYREQATTADKYGLPLLCTSGLSCSARIEIQTKAMKASAVYTFPKQACGIHSPSQHQGLHGDADITELGEILSRAYATFSLQERPLSTKRGPSAATASLVGRSHTSFLAGASPCVTDTEVF